MVNVPCNVVFNTLPSKIVEINTVYNFNKNFRKQSQITKFDLQAGIYKNYTSA